MRQVNVNSSYRHLQINVLSYDVAVFSGKRHVVKSIRVHA